MATAIMKDLGLKTERKLIWHSLNHFSLFGLMFWIIILLKIKVYTYTEFSDKVPRFYISYLKSIHDAMHCNKFFERETGP